MPGDGTRADVVETSAPAQASPATDWVADRRGGQDPVIAPSVWIGWLPVRTWARMVCLFSKVGRVDRATETKKARTVVALRHLVPVQGNVPVSTGTCELGRSER